MNERPTTRTRSILAAVLVALVVGASAGVAGYAVLSRDNGTTTVVRQVGVGAQAQSTSNSSLLSVGQIYTDTHKGVVEITVSSTSSRLRARASSTAQRATSSRTSTS
jgi:hypothetical protein